MILKKIYKNFYIIDNIKMEIYCKDCYKIFKTVSSLNRHKRVTCKKVVDEYYISDKKEEYKCEICNKIYIDRISYIRHEEMIPLCKIGYKECERCGCKIKKYKDYKNHKLECDKKKIDIVEVKRRVVIEFD